MKYFVVVPFTAETQQGKVILPVGKILELSEDQARKLSSKLKPVPPNGGRDLPAYCEIGNAWCSSKLGLTPCRECEKSIKPALPETKGE